MISMQLTHAGEPLQLVESATPSPGPGQLRIRIEACGVCRTDLHLIDGELDPAPLPIVPGHEVVGVVEAVGAGVDPDWLDARVGVPWLGSTCGHCGFCESARENLCDTPGFTGYTLPGGYASHLLARADYCFRLPLEFDDPVRAAPLLCAGLIGWRCLRKCGDARRIGLYGFGAAAHLLAQVLRAQGRECFAFTRAGDTAAQALARELGAAWAGDSDQPPPIELDAAIIFAPVGPLVPSALRALRRGGRVVCGGIHMSDIPSFPYAWLWGEREIVSVANLTRADGESFFPFAARIGLRAHARAYPMREANRALDDLRAGRVHGAAVLVP